MEAWRGRGEVGEVHEETLRKGSSEVGREL